MRKFLKQKLEDKKNMERKHINISMSDVLQCTICLGTLQDPVIIVNPNTQNPCLHRFCENCIHQIPKNKGRRKCPG